ncbi:MAG: molybdate ABC transporter substrate-binding protein [Colwelliaceae bacterium]|nr:molybdate ABC transporter substrate-binding protein [Colwelliaceae bacterium]
MMKKCLLTIYIFFFLSLFIHPEAIGNQQSNEQSSPLKIAVSANFSHTLSKLLPLFEAKTGIKTQLFIGSTGSLFQQIQHGAAYDIFIAADKLRPQRLIEANLALDDSVKTYAFGTVSFWSSLWQQAPNTPLPTLNKIFQHIQNKQYKVAIANPKIAPYGMAAKQIFEKKGLWNKVIKKQLITGSNINQTFQQTRSGAVSIGIVANSQLKVNGLTGITIPDSYYQPIEQQLVILKSSKKIIQAQALSKFLLSYESQKLISSNGYYPIQPSINKEVISKREVSYD